MGTGHTCTCLHGQHGLYIPHTTCQLLLRGSGTLEPSPSALEDGPCCGGNSGQPQCPRSPSARRCSPAHPTHRDTGPPGPQGHSWQQHSVGLPGEEWRVGAEQSTSHQPGCRAPALTTAQALLFAEHGLLQGTAVGQQLPGSGCQTPLHHRLWTHGGAGGGERCSGAGLGRAKQDWVG